jgi:hypothetical protein
MWLPSPFDSRVLLVEDDWIVFSANEYRHEATTGYTPSQAELRQAVAEKRFYVFNASTKEVTTYKQSDYGVPLCLKDGVLFFMWGDHPEAYAGHPVNCSLRKYRISDMRLLSTTEVSGTDAQDLVAGFCFDYRPLLNIEVDETDLGKVRVTWDSIMFSMKRGPTTKP